MAGNDATFFRRLLEDFGARIHVAAPARVIRLYSDRTADVVPLYKEEGGEASPILSVPYLKHIQPYNETTGGGDIRVGSAVWLNFADQSLDEMLGAASFTPVSEVRHDRKDAVIVGVF